jgi:hypothetical protein
MHINIYIYVYIYIYIRILYIHACLRFGGEKAIYFMYRYICVYIRKCILYISVYRYVIKQMCVPICKNKVQKYSLIYTCHWYMFFQIKRFYSPIITDTI